ncbi:MAG: valine--tRNA ligase [Streptosporangiales bacterium]|nr:valine--tRNA ligase [Streptosporangiales bacterium]
MAVPDRPSLSGLEEKWSRIWDEQRTYAFDRTRHRAEVYSIDTPPPTVSGTLHVGSMFSYTHTDLVARYKRMRGYRVFYPIGWDDNGLPTERRVQNYFGVRCDPTLPKDPDFTPPANPRGEPVAVSRPDFIALCLTLTAADEQEFERTFRTLGLSVDWTHTYTTIGDRARRVAQASFLREVRRGDAYQAEGPTLWDVDFGTAVAQAEVEDREIAGAYHALPFHTADGGDVLVETTRPELLPACVALVCHPDDERYAGLVGTRVDTPLFGASVPVYAHRLADPAKGTGIAMVCTFGDLTDVVWWRELDLPVRAVVGRDGRFLATPPAGVATAPYAELAGLTVRRARERLVELLRDAGELRGEPRSVTHAVNFYEKGDRPLEIVSTRQWYLRNGGRDESLRSALLARGRQLRWHPAHMAARYEDWVRGLAGDWLVSRQRYFGVPIPAWYPVGDDGVVDHQRPLLPAEDTLPVDPSTDPAPGYREEQRGRPGGFVADPDVFDTWATSSLSPQIVGGWLDDADLHGRVFPFDLRPQAHDIIRTWLFGTVVRAQLEHGSLPWRHAAISGFIYDPDRKKMSKSKGNAVTPAAVLEKYGADAFRYWAAHGRLGVDATYDDAMMRVGRRLAIKLLNVSKFVLTMAGDADPTAVREPLDLAMLGRLADVVADATDALDDYEHARALQLVEDAFWAFCDDHVELVKARAYGERGAAAQASAVFHRLLAPFLPYVAEEVWSWWQDGSVHRAEWPSATQVRELGAGDPELVDLAGAAIAAVRRAKSQAQLSMRADVSQLRIVAAEEVLARLRPALDDVAAAGRVAETSCVAGGDEQPIYTVELAEQPIDASLDLPRAVTPPHGSC